jgi:para-aminobenzoate synthetase component I
VDADRRRAELAVGIRTFWIDRTPAGGPVLRFGAGAGITWGSDPAGEWAETELKAGRLLAVASEEGRGTPSGPRPEPARDRAAGQRAVHPLERPAGNGQEQAPAPVPGSSPGRADASGPPPGHSTSGRMLR